MIVANYLRGIDGLLPGKDMAKEQDKKDKEKGGDMERPEGDAQIDYLRRLAVQIRASEKEDRIGAIGVLGNDYHDKLLVLEALRPMFPDAVFFTTDLDAAMLNREDNKFTRNLVVASGYGLTLTPKLQKDIPPFRNSYQTAVFLATQVAVIGSKKQPCLGEEQMKCWLTPQLFEIGRTEAVPLASEAMPLAYKEKTCEKLCSCPYPHIEAPPPDWKKALVAPFGFSIIWLIASFTGFVDVDRKHFMFWLLALAGITIVSFSLVAFLGFNPAGREPFSWVQGVSIWPAELLRLLSLVFSIVFFVWGRHRLREKHREIELRYFSGDISVIGDGRGPHEIWKQYVEPGGDDSLPWHMHSSIWLRGFVFVAVYMGAVRILIYTGVMDRPVAPLRGVAEFRIDELITYAMVFACLALLFYTIDKANHAVWLIQELKKQTCRSGKSPAFYRTRPRPKGEIHYQSIPEYRTGTHLVASATEPVQRIIFYPFPILALLIVSRSPLFDGWYIPPVLYITFLTAIVLVVLAAIRLRRTAEGMRTEDMLILNRQLMDAQAGNKEGDAKQITSMLSQLRELRTGAFAPFSQQPLVKALLTILGSASGITLLEYATQLNF